MTSRSHPRGGETSRALLLHNLCALNLAASPHSRSTTERDGWKKCRGGNDGGREGREGVRELKAVML